MERSLSAVSGTLQGLPAARERKTELGPGMADGSRPLTPRPCPNPGTTLNKHAALCAAACLLKHTLLDTLSQFTGCLCHQSEEPPTPPHTPRKAGLGVGPLTPPQRAMGIRREDRQRVCWPKVAPLRVKRKEKKKISVNQASDPRPAARVPKGQGNLMEDKAWCSPSEDSLPS